MVSNAIEVLIGLTVYGDNDMKKENEQWNISQEMKQWSYLKINEGR